MQHGNLMRHGVSLGTLYASRADHFSKHLLGLENNEVDIKMIQKDLPKTK